MARRRRQRADSSEYTDADGNALELRGSISAPTRAAYARIASGVELPPGASREDAWQRSFEFLFERLAVSWTIAGAPPLERQRELLGRLRMASATERDWVRGCLRTHCERYFPDVNAP